MQKILIQLDSANELICYEAVSLAMTLATFEHEVQLVCQSKTYGVLLNSNSRIYGMIQSFPLYDMPTVWLDGNQYGNQSDQAEWLLQNVESDLANQFEIMTAKIDLSAFDTVLSF